MSLSIVSVLTTKISKEITKKEPPKPQGTSYLERGRGGEISVKFGPNLKWPQRISYLEREREIDRLG